MALTLAEMAALERDPLKQVILDALLHSPELYDRCTEKYRKHLQLGPLRIPTPFFGYRTAYRPKDLVMVEYHRRELPPITELLQGSPQRDDLPKFVFTNDSTNRTLEELDCCDPSD